MRNSKKFSYVSNEIQEDYKPKLVKGRTGWVVKGLVYASLVGVGLMVVNVAETQAAEWTPNTAETIRAKIKEGDTSYTFVEGDTFYEIGRAINVKYTVLMELNGFAEGTQYTVPVGTTITFDGRKVTLTDKDGKVVNEKILSDDAKVDKSQPFMNQKSDTIKGTSVTINNQSTSTNNDGNSGKPNPVQPVIPVKPIKPTDPTTPIKPVDPKPEENRLAELKKQLAELEAQLANKQTELEDAITRLNEANAQNRENSIILANAQITVNNFNDELIAAESAVVSAQNTVTEAQAAIDAWQPTDKETEIPKSLVEALNAAQTELAAAQANKEAIKTQKTAAEQALEEAKQLPMINTATILERIAIINDEINNLQQKIDEVKAEISKLEGNTKPTEDAKLEEARQKALNTLGTLNLLPEELADFTAVIQSAKSIEEINDYLAQAQLAHDKNEAIENESKELKAEKAKAIKQLEELNLGSEDKEVLSYQINNAVSIEEINDILINAKSISDGNDKKEEAEKLKLEAAKSDAKKEIATLNLSDEEQATFISLVDNAKTVAEVSDALENARQVSEKNNQNEQSQLEKTKKEAINSLGGLNLKNSEKAEFINKIEKAQTIAEINSILKEAQAISNKNDEAASEKELSEAKNQAKSELAKMNLTQSQNIEFEKQIDEATTVSSINLIIANAQKVSDKNDADTEQAKKLEEAKQSAKSSLKGMNLNQAQKADFEKQIDNAKSVDGVNLVVANAQKASDVNNANEANAEKLAKSKEQAVKDVNALEFLPQAEKDKFLSEIDGSKSISEVNAAVENAKKLDTQFKDDASNTEKLEASRKSVLEELKGLNLKGNTSFEAQIKNAKTESEIKTALDAAKTESAKNDKADASAKELEQAKKDVIETVNIMNNITDTQKQTFISQINRAKTTMEIDKVLASATKENAVIEYIEDYNEISIEEVKEVAENILATIPEKSDDDAYNSYESIDSIISKKTDTKDETFNRIYDEIKMNQNYQLSESDYEDLRIYFEINDRYTKRMIENINTLRSELGLSPLNYVELSDKAKAAMFAHTVAGEIAKNHVTTRNGAIVYKEIGFGGENLQPLTSAEKFNKIGAPMTVEALADLMFKKELNEYKYYSHESNDDNGHLHNIISGKSDSATYGGLLIKERKEITGPFGMKGVQYLYSITELYGSK